MKKAMNRGARVQRKPNAAPGPPSIKYPAAENARVPAAAKKSISRPRVREDAKADAHAQEDNFKELSY